MNNKDASIVIFFQYPNFFLRSDEVVPRPDYPNRFNLLPYSGRGATSSEHAVQPRPNVVNFLISQNRITFYVNIRIICMISQKKKSK